MNAEQIAKVGKKAMVFGDLMNLACTAQEIIEPMKGYPLNNEDKGMIEAWLKMFDEFVEQ